MCSTRHMRVALSRLCQMETIDFTVKIGMRHYRDRKWVWRLYLSWRHGMRAWWMLRLQVVWQALNQTWSPWIHPHRPSTNCSSPGLSSPIGYIIKINLFCNYRLYIIQQVKHSRKVTLNSPPFRFLLPYLIFCWEDTECSGDITHDIDIASVSFH